MKHNGTLVRTTDNRTSCMDQRQHVHLGHNRIIRCVCVKRWWTQQLQRLLRVDQARDQYIYRTYKKHLKRIIAVCMKGARERESLQLLKRERERERDLGHGDCYNRFGQESVSCSVAGWFTGRQGKEKSVVESTECKTILVRQSTTTTTSTTQ